MCKLFILLFFSLILLEINTEDIKKGWAFVGNPLLSARPCKGNNVITLNYEPGLPPGEENVYYLHIRENLPAPTRIYIKFDSSATVTLTDTSKARISVEQEDTFAIRFFAQSQEGISMIVKGPPSGLTIPYPTSIVVNTVQYCNNPDVGILDNFIKGVEGSAQTSLTVPDDTCGRRKVVHTELITSGLVTKAGDWPWHAALNKLEGQSVKYICGGTLISKTIVLTAAHCVTNRGEPLIPELLSVTLGKYNLIGGDLAAQEIEIHQITVHENFEPSRLDNDIALLKLKSEAIYTDYVQPACLWRASDYKKLPSSTVYGTVIGWGFDHTDNLSTKLNQATMLKVSENACIKSNPLFFANLLTRSKFCAGLRNGTSACNGDSGGGFFVFVPDVSGDSSANGTGTWHIRGIISLAVARRNIALCDPSQYVIFTDIAQFGSWLSDKIK